jgi:hypothetical protein
MRFADEEQMGIAMGQRLICNDRSKGIKQGTRLGGTLQGQDGVVSRSDGHPSSYLPSSTPSRQEGASRPWRAGTPPHNTLHVLR